jgi:hypothetical protein
VRVLLAAFVRSLLSGTSRPLSNLSFPSCACSRNPQKPRTLRCMPPTIYRRQNPVLDGEGSCPSNLDPGAF